MNIFDWRLITVLGDTLETTDGTEMNVAKEYARRHNFTVKLVIDEVNEWGDIYDNWTGNGVLGNVAMDYADAGFVALYSWHQEYVFLDISLPVVRTGITCIAPAPRPIGGWLVPVLPFSPTLWMYVFISFLVAALFIQFIMFLSKYLNRLENEVSMLSAQMTLRLFLLQPVSETSHPNTTAFKNMISALLLLSLTLSCSYSSGLASSLTVPRYEKSIKTARDLADSGMTWAATHDAWIFSILDTIDPTLITLVKNFQPLKKEELKRRSTERNLAFSVERLPAAHYAIGDYITEDSVPYLKLMAEDIYWEQCVFWLRKSSPYLSSINQMILRIHEAGLLAVWELQATLKHMNNKIQLAVRLSQHDPKNPELVKLKFSHLQGVYVIWTLGLITSLICFIIEILISKLYK